MTGRGWFLLASAALAIGGCAEELPPLRLSGGGISYYSDVDVEISPRLLDAIGLHRDALAAALGVQPAPAIEYVLYARVDDVHRVCRSVATACAPGIRAISPHPLDLHELVHVSTTRWGTPPAAFVEGIAMVYGTDGGNPEFVAHDLPLELVVSSELFDEGVRTPALPSEYLSAAAMVSYLIDRFGEDRFMAFYAVARDGDDLVTLDRKAEESFGVTMSEAHAAWSALPPSPGYAISRRVFECAAPSARVGEIETLDLVRGVSSDVSWGGVLRTIDVAEPAVVRVRATGVAPAISVGSCERGPTVYAGGVLEDRAIDDEVPVEAGRYFIWLQGMMLSPEDAETEVTLGIDVIPTTP